MRLKLPIRSTFALAVLSGFTVVATSPAVAFIMPVTLAPDAQNTANWLAQLAHMGTITADDATRYQQLALQIRDADTELTKIGSLAFDAPGAMQQFGSYALALENRYPTAAATLLAQATLDSQHGTVASANIDSLRREMLAANGTMQAQASLGDMLLAMMSQADNAAKFRAAQVRDQDAKSSEAAADRSSLLDVNEKDPTIGMLY